MAESVVTFFLEKLSEQITQEANLLIGVDEQINSLRNELELTRSYLKNADARRKEDVLVRAWVNQLRDVTYEAEDVIDDFILKIERHQRRTGVVGSLKSCLGSTKHLKTRHDVGLRLEQIKGRVADIFANKSKLGIEPIIQLGEASSSTNQGLSRMQRNPVVEEEVVGIEDEEKMLVTQLTQGEMPLHVISIVGMGGLGKTTLAKRLYNSIDVSKHFDCRAWISLSQEYIIKNVLMEIIKQVRVLGEEEKNRLKKMDDNEETVREELLQYLQGRKYLVVIDDIWSIDAWKDLESIFPREAKGSRVMLTTRIKDVALYAKSIPRELRFLTQDESRKLFCKKVFSRNVADVFPEHLQDIGEKIVKQCGGLPLAVVVLGGLLSMKDPIRTEWEKVLKRVNWQLDKNENPISKILSLSYNDLPHFLKSCFLYFGVFPEDYEIPATKLIQLWVAEGFVQQRGSGTLEDAGEDCLLELISRSMVQLSKRRSNGSIKTCRIHDLLRDLAISEANEIKFLGKEFASPAEARRQTISHSKRLYDDHKCPHLRSLLFFQSNAKLQMASNKSGQIWRLCGKENYVLQPGGFKFLRVLNLSGLFFNTFLVETTKMIHLRYLAFGLRNERDPNLLRVPSSITNLVNLQTLKIEIHYLGAYCHIKLPNNIGSMDQLRHIHIDSFAIDQTFRIDCFTNIQTLSLIEAGGWIEDGLAKLTQLRKLGVCEILYSHKEALSNSIIELGELRSLFLKGGQVPTLKLSNHRNLYSLKLFGILEEPLEVHEFPPYLTNLCLTDSGLECDPMATLEKLPHLKILKLWVLSFIGEKMVCSGGGFPVLEDLEFTWSNYYYKKIQEWKVEKGALSNLKRLYISSYSNPQMLPEGLQHVTTLQELRFDKVNDELKDRIVENGEDWHKIRHVPSVIIDGKKIVIRRI